MAEEVTVLHSGDYIITTSDIIVHQTELLESLDLCLYISCTVCYGSGGGRNIL
jgi:hypothetical protein